MAIRAGKRWPGAHKAWFRLRTASRKPRDAADRAVRVADPYMWVYAYCLDALAAVAIAEGVDDAVDIVARLEQLAARADLRELVVRGALHRARLGDSAGLSAARVLAEAIENPALHAELLTA